MTKDLSKQLCELCEIEPKIRYFLKFMHVEYETTKEDIVARSEIFKTGVLKITKVVRDYPDFTKPENFVRLFNLPIVNNGTRTVGYFVVHEFTMKTIKDFIECLIIKLERTQLSITKEVKQSIREAEWVYV